MRAKPIIRVLGMLLVCEAVLMIPSFLVSLYFKQGDAPAFAVSIAVTLAFGLPPAFLVKSQVRNLYAREGFALVGMGWILLSVFGMLPFIINGAIPSPVDAFFETVSGFTTTGASILRQVEGMPHGLLFWRSFTHWAGGMGVLVLTIALLPQLGLKNMEVMRAESSGPNPEKILPRLRESAKMLYLIYFSLTLIMIVCLLFTGMKPFDSVVNTFATAGTGGFSVLNTSIGGYNNPAAEIVIGIFMFLFGVNFSIYFLIIMRKISKALANQELIVYCSIVFLSVTFITINILPQTGGILSAIRQAFFQVTSIVSTTGFCTLNYDVWPMFSKAIIILLMIIGACAGSTAGGIKVIRVLLAGKAARREMGYLLHPRSVRSIYMDGKQVQESTIRSVLAYFSLYFMILFFAVLLVSLDGLDFTSTFTAVLSAFGNIGPGLGIAGPAGNFADFSAASKLILSVCMLLGRLEIMPILMLFHPSLWRKT